MKAIPVKVENGNKVNCLPEEATHVEIRIPSPSGRLTLPVILSGSRDKSGCWTWNGSVDTPTLKPSVLVRGYSDELGREFNCHTWITDGKAIFLNDCTHYNVGKTLNLIEID